MGRYIDADALKEWIDEYVSVFKKSDTREIKGYIEHQPTIDTVSVVRCKCDFGKCHEQGDTLYESSDWDGGIGFDYIRDIKYCPLCGGLLDGEEQTEREGE